MIRPFVYNHFTDHNHPPSDTVLGRWGSPSDLVTNNRRALVQCMVLGVLFTPVMCWFSFVYFETGSLYVLEPAVYPRLALNLWGSASTSQVVGLKSYATTFDPGIYRVKYCLGCCSLGCFWVCFLVFGFFLVSHHRQHSHLEHFFWLINHCGSWEQLLGVSLGYESSGVKIAQ